MLFLYIHQIRTSPTLNYINYNKILVQVELDQYLISVTTKDRIKARCVAGEPLMATPEDGKNILQEKLVA